MRAGTSLSSEVSAEDYSDLVTRLHGMRFSFLGEQGSSSAGASHNPSGEPGASFGAGTAEEEALSGSGFSSSSPHQHNSPQQSGEPPVRANACMRPGLIRLL
jgi:hypothetical protein